MVWVIWVRTLVSIRTILHMLKCSNFNAQYCRIWMDMGDYGLNFISNTLNLTSIRTGGWAATESSSGASFWSTSHVKSAVFQSLFGSNWDAKNGVWLVVWNIYYFSISLSLYIYIYIYIYIGNNHPNGRTHIFQRASNSPPTRAGFRKTGWTASPRSPIVPWMVSMSISDSYEEWQIHRWYIPIDIFWPIKHDHVP